ncbi:MAG: chaperone modulator CbpM [Gammaproteobacteria bacterium]|nr:chaperone modulator CbpM [Gammaproteobacteria bacterium]
MAQNNKDITITAILVDDASTYGLNEVLQQYEMDRAVLLEMIDQGLITLVKTPSGEELIDARAMQRIQMALRLQHDLEINLSGVALVLELLDELKTMRNEVDLFHKYLSK